MEEVSFFMASQGHNQIILLLLILIYPDDWHCCSCCSVMSVFLQSHRLQHARLPCPSPSPRVCSNSCPLSQWCHSTISSSVIHFSFCLQSFPASGSFPVNQFFKCWSFSFSISSSSEYSRLISFRIDWFELLAVQGTLKSLCFPAPEFKGIRLVMCTKLYVLPSENMV